MSACEKGASERAGLKSRPDPGCRCGTTASTATSTRSARTATRSDPDRPLAEVRRLSGWLAERDGRVWLERGCPDHGLVRTLYDESPEILAYLEQWTAPTKVHEPDVPGNFEPVPSAYADGLPEMQTQHTCILLEDITDHCNLRCPTCFAESSPALAVGRPARGGAGVDRRPALARERPHRRADAVAAASRRSTRWLAELLDDRGRPADRADPGQHQRPADRPGRRRSLACCTRHRERVEVYLQYDGESRRGVRPTTAAPTSAGSRSGRIERLSAAGVFTTLTMTAALGVNDDEIGAVVKRALDTPYVGGVTDPAGVRLRAVRRASTRCDRLTHTGVLARLEEQTGGLVTWRDLTALPCSHPHCCSVGYLLRDDSGTWRSLTALIGHDRLKQWLDLEPDVLANRIADDAIPGDPEQVGQGLAARPALRAVVAVAPVDGGDLARHLRELRPRHRHAHDARAVGAARAAQAAARRCSASGSCGSRSSRSWTCTR